MSLAMHGRKIAANLLRTDSGAWLAIYPWSLLSTGQRQFVFLNHKHPSARQPVSMYCVKKLRVSRNNAQGFPVARSFESCHIFLWQDSKFCFCLKTIKPIANNASGFSSKIAKLLVEGNHSLLRTTGHGSPAEPKLVMIFNRYKVLLLSYVVFQGCSPRPVVRF